MSGRKKTSEKAKVARRKVRREMPYLRRDPDKSGAYPIALVCSDIHLCHKPPLARSKEPDWYAAMERPIKELRRVSELNNLHILCAGDIFDKWNSPPELINFALDTLPGMIAIPGQHDLPNHSYKEITKSAYYTLKRAGRIVNLQPGTKFPLWVRSSGGVQGFPWDYPFKEHEFHPNMKVKICLVHQYVWRDKGNCFPGAPKEKNASKLLKIGKEFCNTIITGDNHIGFACEDGTKLNRCFLYNCGCFIPRKKDEGPHATYGVLYSNGTVERKWIFDDQAVWLTEKEMAGTLTGIVDFDSLVQEFSNLKNKEVDFIGMVKQLIHKEELGKRVRNILRELLEAYSD